MVQLRNSLALALFAASFCQGPDARAATLKVRANGVLPGRSSSPTPDNAHKPYALVPAELAKDLDSKKIKEGDAVFARMTIKLQNRPVGP